MICVIAVHWLCADASDKGSEFVLIFGILFFNVLRTKTVLIFFFCLRIISTLDRICIFYLTTSGFLIPSSYLKKNRIIKNTHKHTLTHTHLKKIWKKIKFYLTSIRLHILSFLCEYRIKIDCSHNVRKRPELTQIIQDTHNNCVLRQDERLCPAFGFFFYYFEQILRIQIQNCFPLITIG